MSVLALASETALPCSGILRGAVGDRSQNGDSGSVMRHRSTGPVRLVSADSYEESWDLGDRLDLSCWME